MLPRLSLRSRCPLGRIGDLVFVRELLIPTYYSLKYLLVSWILGSFASGYLSLSPPPLSGYIPPVAHTPRVPECRDGFCFTTV
ncbi:hypothetical protein BDV26DRAFT_261333 [Aspergillus bertholletiae]|uniref:Uncharacterized protein n=1 Tax=Aspergillus bertholletiae TaxID=1226010 RepID=A0A5N7B9X4_9EURO|nr:hypothetical protein BDV26DRAFT_261333 [Aspergillus bertholletiae]